MRKGGRAWWRAPATPAPGQPVTELEEGSLVYGSSQTEEEAGDTGAQGSKGGGRGFPKAVVPSGRDGHGDGVVCGR